MKNILEFTFNLYNLLEEPLKQEAPLNDWDLFFKRCNLQPLVMIFSDVGSHKKTSVLIGLRTGSWTNCPFPKALAMLINQIIEARVLPGQDFTVFL